MTDQNVIPDRTVAKSVVSRREHDAFRILHGFPTGQDEAQWRTCLANSEFATHYASPEFFCEPMVQKTRGFAILGIVHGEIAGVLTGINNGDHVQSGLSVRPQIAFSRDVDRARAMTSLLTGLIEEARTAKLVDLFLWSDMENLVDSRFRQRRYEGVVMLDLSRGPDALFRRFSENKRINIRKAIKYGVVVEPAQSREEISVYHAICADWSRRKQLSVPEEKEFQRLFALTKNRRLLLARHEGKIIAGVVIRFAPRGVMEYAANSSLESALRLRPNDLLHWRAIEWGCRMGMTKYSLGGTHLFLRKFGGEITPTTRCRLDQSLFRRFTIGDWIADQANRTRPLVSERLADAAHTLRALLRKRSASGAAR